MGLPPVETPQDGKKVFATVLQWLLSALPTDANGALGDLPTSLGAFINGAIENNGVVDPSNVISAVASALGNSGQIDIGDGGAIKFESGHIKPELSLGPVKPGTLPGNPPVHISKVTFGADHTLNLNECAFNGFSIKLTDLRFGAGGGSEQTSGLVAGLLPDLREVPGFQLALEFTASPLKVKVSGGGKVPIERSLGPLIWWP